VARWPAPKRGEVVRQLGDALREHKEDLGLLVTLEVGKIRSEGLGEVQEMIDMADFAVGLSRQLYGLSMHSERPLHRMYEQWHPLGPVGVITAFNFPVAVWAWNAMIAAVCGDSVLWKPSEHAPLSAIAVTKIAERVLAANGAPPIFGLAVGDRRAVGAPLAADRRFPLISATGSVTMGRAIGQVVAQRLGRSLLELGGNNGIVVTRDADLDLALRAVLFAAVGTAGQRCTTTRRLFLEKPIAAEMKAQARPGLRLDPHRRPGRPRHAHGPAHPRARGRRLPSSARARRRTGRERSSAAARFSTAPASSSNRRWSRRCRTCRSLARRPSRRSSTSSNSTTLDEAIELHNAVPQGLSSAIFTLNVRSAERFLSVDGSDCGIANVNIGTSGAEIGGAFGGEKETGGGREAGSDSWKLYMRRQTCTINYGEQLPLAQGVEFDV
jgi:aldehyde dehydrogenase (NAD+)